MKLTFFERLTITDKHRQDWYRAVAKVTKDGLSMFDALDKMAVEFAKIKHPMTPLVQIVLLRLRGAGVSHSGQNQRTLGTELIGLVPEDEAMMVQAGDKSGKIYAGLSNAADLVKTKSTLKSSVMSSLRKPVGYILAMNALLLYLSVKLLPSFEKSKPREFWPGRAQLLGSLADHSVLIVSVVGVLLVACAIGVKWLVPNWANETRDRFDRWVFPFTLIAAINGASFLKMIASYINSGTGFVEAVMQVNATATPYVRYQCAKLLDLVKRGRRGEEALCQLAIVPQRYHWIIVVYGLSGDPAKTYERIAEEMVEGVQTVVKTVFEYVISSAILAVIGLLAFWIYGSMFDIALSTPQPQ